MLSGGWRGERGGRWQRKMATSLRQSEGGWGLVLAWVASGQQEEDIKRKLLFNIALLSGKTTEEELPLKLADKFHNKDVVRRGENASSGEEPLFHALKILDCHET